MARRSIYPYDYEAFRDFIAAARKDLEIETARIRFSFHPAVTYYGTTITWHIEDNKKFRHKLVIDPCNALEEICKTVLHELRHVWQHETHIVADCFDGYRIWKGQKYKFVYPSQDWEAYENLPWEIDAREYEDHYVNLIHLVRSKVS